ncbi:MAG TPA: EsaB/YukD family protein [Candidatus Dormibacteraeota bacterium]|nr:EsaB/YukD family protein [Candidatus Dormibacteraeota bacterium]
MTVQGPDQRVELQLPVDRPVMELVPLLVEVCGGGHQSESSRWELGPMGGLAFDPSKSLAEVGVVDGALLHLRDTVAGTSEAALPPDPGPAQPSWSLPPWPEGGPSSPWTEGGPSSWPEGEASAQASPRWSPPSWSPETWPGQHWSGAGTESQPVVLPQDRTRSVLPPRTPLPGRLASVVQAAVAPPRPPRPSLAAEPQPGQIINPAALMVKTVPNLAERVRMSWRSTDYLTRLEEAIVAPQLHRCATIAVMSPKGGVGKTTVATLLGTLLAFLRRDRIVAIDTNPDFGSLGRQLAPDHTVFVDDLYEVLDEPELTATTLDNHLSRAAHGLMVLPAPTDPVRVARLDTNAYTKVVRKLQQMVGVIVLDSGAGLHEPAARAALDTADQVVLVSDAEPATASLVAEAATVLKQDGLPIWLVMNKTGVPTDLDLRAFGAIVPHARGMVEIKNELTAARTVAAGRFQWLDAPRSWKRSLRELAAALVLDWPQLGIAS